MKTLANKKDILPEPKTPVKFVSHFPPYTVHTGFMITREHSESGKIFNFFYSCEEGTGRPIFQCNASELKSWEYVPENI